MFVALIRISIERLGSLHQLTLLGYRALSSIPTSSEEVMRCEGETGGVRVIRRVA